MDTCPACHGSGSDSDGVPHVAGQKAAHLVRQPPGFRGGGRKPAGRQPAGRAPPARAAAGHLAHAFRAETGIRVQGCMLGSRRPRAPDAGFSGRSHLAARLRASSVSTAHR